MLRSVNFTTIKIDLFKGKKTLMRPFFPLSQFVFFVVLYLKTGRALREMMSDQQATECCHLSWNLTRQEGLCRRD